ncbi:hypothetical protein [Pseudooctadecabacter jejudonensis]|uniref:Lipoprotein n=1 Tax=Pseudooctadecabacter jejudonensis TaxID=1391910 RepID=A0A1Y5RHW8_9RHOB|nr:hypothetical protein [Pseudooctadecabacter jejudonensis]SLN15047.1 hypothetical protein PSJ8397_00319 [Pseudooctadecabacter jejudonensis]
MRKSALLCLCFLAACSDKANHLGNPLLLPFNAVSNAVGNAAYANRRAKVEVFVKTNHPALMSDLRAGGGPTLTAAFDLANVPASVRAPHTLQMQSDAALYQTNYAALITAIMVVSNV